MEEPFLKDTKFLNALSKTAETAYNSGASGKNNSKYAQDAYKQELDDSLQNEDTLRSIIFDFKAEADLKSIGDDLESGAIDIQGAREKVIVALTQAREDAYNDGKVAYDTKSGEMTQAEKESLRKVNSKLTILDGAADGSTFIVGIGRGANNGATKLGDKYFLTDKNGTMITDTAGNGRELSKEQLAEYLNINVRGLKWLTK